MSSFDYEIATALEGTQRVLDVRLGEIAGLLRDILLAIEAKTDKEEG